MGPLHRDMYVPSEMSSRSLHKPYIVAEGHAMKIMHICYRTIVVGGQNIQLPRGYGVGIL